MKKASRRTVIKQLLAGSALAAFLPLYAYQKSHAAHRASFQHSVCRWTFSQLNIDVLCQAVRKLGFAAIDLVGPEDWPVLKQYGVYSSMCNGAELNLTDGWCDPQFHPQLIENYSRLIPKVAEAGYKNLICFSGSSRGMSPEEGLNHCVNGLKQILPLAQQHGVILQMELLNSKVDHPDYMANHTAWGVALCQRLNSPNFKLLYDIYHMQIMEGDVIRTLQQNQEFIGHYHTAGVPGRHEIDDSQELYYPAIMQAIAQTNFRGYVAQEFIPTAANPLASLQGAIRRCSV